MCVCDVGPWKGTVELKGAEVAAATVPLAVTPTVKGSYGRPHPRGQADSIEFDVWVDSRHLIPSCVTRRRYADQAMHKARSVAGRSDRATMSAALTMIQTVEAVETVPKSGIGFLVERMVGPVGYV